MSSPVLYEVIGHIASLIVMASFVMTSTVKLRIVNSIGSTLCAIYSLLIKAYPIAVCNIFIVATNIYQLSRVLHNKNNNYTIVPCDVNERMVTVFIDKYLSDIKKYHPHFDPQRANCNYASFIFSKNEVVGLQIGKLEGEELSLVLDYSTPEYRDCSVGRYAYAQMKKEHGVKVAYFTEVNKNTKDYLGKVGFVEKQGRYALNFD